jgi:site-specific DNA-methyltransferase (adenine-specific)
MGHVVFESELGQLVHGDALDIMHKYNGQADVVFLDPPFNLNKLYGPLVNDALPEVEYKEWLGSLLRLSAAALRPGGSIFMYHLPRWAVWAAGQLEQSGFVFRHLIATYMPTRPPIAGRLHPSHYSVLYMAKEGPRTFHRLRVPVPSCRHCSRPLKDYGGHAKELKPEGLSLSDFWADTHGVHHRKHKFGRTGPVLPDMIPERCVLTASNPGDLVIDPCAGSATTGAVCERLGRRWLCIEKEDCTAAKLRLEATLQEQPQAVLGG